MSRFPFTPFLVYTPVSRGLAQTYNDLLVTASIHPPREPTAPEAVFYIQIVIAKGEVYLRACAQPGAVLPPDPPAS